MVGQCVLYHQSKSILYRLYAEQCPLHDEDDSIVLKGTVMYTAGHHKPLVYADMFYAEALLKLKGSEFLIW